MCWIKKLPPVKTLFPRKLSWKLTLIYVVLFSGVIIALNIGTLFGVRFFLIKQIKQQVQDSTENTLHSISEEGWNPNDDGWLAETYSHPEMSISIADSSGHKLHSSKELPAGLPAPTRWIGEIQVYELQDLHVVIQNSRIVLNGQLHGYLQVSYNMRTEYHFMKLLILVMAVADALGVLFSMWVGAFISRHALRPIDSITKAAKKISGSDLAGRVEVGRADDELTRLALTFNEMIERLQRSFEKQNRFVSDASHELRTPIAVIQGYADMIIRWGKNDPEVLKESVIAIEKETENMKALVERLLFLARNDQAEMRMKMEPFNLYAVLLEVAEENRMAFHRSISIRIAESITLTADRALIKQMLRALTDNAVKYTPIDGAITIEAMKKGNGVTIVVQDSGIGIPAKDLPHVFDRFYRVDKARSRERGGTGLGLSIVQRIVEAHHGTIQIESKPGQGTAICIFIPDKIET